MAELSAPTQSPSSSAGQATSVTSSQPIHSQEAAPEAEEVVVSDSEGGSGGSGAALAPAAPCPPPPPPQTQPEIITVKPHGIMITTKGSNTNFHPFLGVDLRPAANRNGLNLAICPTLGEACVLVDIGVVWRGIHGYEPTTSREKGGHKFRMPRERYEGDTVLMEKLSQVPDHQAFKALTQELVESGEVGRMAPQLVFQPAAGMPAGKRGPRQTAPGSNNKGRATSRGWSSSRGSGPGTSSSSDRDSEAQEEQLEDEECEQPKRELVDPTAGEGTEPAVVAAQQQQQAADAQGGPLKHRRNGVPQRQIAGLGAGPSTAAALAPRTAAEHVQTAQRGKQPGRGRGNWGKRKRPDASCPFVGGRGRGGKRTKPGGMGANGVGDGTVPNTSGRLAEGGRVAQNEGTQEQPQDGEKEEEAHVAAAAIAGGGGAAAGAAPVASSGCLQLQQELMAAAGQAGAAAAGLTPGLIGRYMSVLHQGRQHRAIEEQEVAVLRSFLRTRGMLAAAAAFMQDIARQLA